MVVLLTTHTMDLNPEQANVLENVQSGRNIFLTGSPGSGKSFCVKSIISNLIRNNKRFGITAMTGSAAVLIGGTTVHSFLGIGLAKDSAENIVYGLLKYKHKLILGLHSLLIDECSMLSDSLFDKIDAIFKIVRKNDRPFGGTQIILVGDGFQLAPIEGNYCFLSKNFANNFDVTCLNANMRQRDDTLFKNLLDRVRWGKCSDADLKTLKDLSETEFPDGIVPTKLFSRNIDVDAINNTELAKLKSDTKSYATLYLTKTSKSYITSNKIPLSVTLCVGAQVMITRNISICDGLVNGTRGIVLEMLPTGVIITTLNGTVVVDYFNVKTPELNFSYLPLKLAWAVTIHSSQGMTLDALEIDLGNVFASGQSYTGLSRAKNLKSVRIINVTKSSFKTNAQVIDFYDQLVKNTV